MLNQHDPHPTVFDALVDGMDRLENGSNHDIILTRYLWTLLVECGYKPELRVFKESVDPETETVLFSPKEGGVVDGPEVPGRWRVRMTTLSILDRITTEDQPDGVDPVSVNRAAKLLAAYMREILGTEPTTLGLVFRTRRWRV